MVGIEQRYRRMLDEVERQCKIAGRDPGAVDLVAVSKTVDVCGVGLAYEAGARSFGENRPDQIVQKARAYPEASWHFIGNIQSRRIPDIVASASLIHSLFKWEHALKIDAAAAKCGKVQDVLIEVNVSGEESKSGVAPQQARELVQACATLGHMRVRGLMTMAPQGDTEIARRCFFGLAELKDAIASTLDAGQAACFNELSMGMSEDWQEAVCEGATMIRIGRAIFSDAFEQ